MTWAVFNAWNFHSFHPLSYLQIPSSIQQMTFNYFLSHLPCLPTFSSLLVFPPFLPSFSCILFFHHSLSSSLCAVLKTKLCIGAEASYIHKICLKLYYIQNKYFIINSYKIKFCIKKEPFSNSTSKKINIFCFFRFY